jgi:DNA replication and repair protein RecF
MRVLSVTLRDFRGYQHASAPLGTGLTVVWGANGAGKTNLLEALYFGSTGYSCRTSSERELVRFGATAARVSIRAIDAAAGEHEFAVGYAPGQPKRMSIDGAAVERLVDAPSRPLVSFFSPDRLELIKGVPTLRRAHLDQFVAALWPARTAPRRAYNEALAQRNALLARIARGRADRQSLHTWDRQLAAAGIKLVEDRRAAVGLIAQHFTEMGARLGLEGVLEIAYRPRSAAKDAEGLAGELEVRHAGDLDRGFTSHGPHRDEIGISHEGRLLRTYGSQGQQRVGLLALLLAEKDVLAGARPAPPLLLLDDVMSELDADRRGALVEVLRATNGQTVISTTDLDHVPGARAAGAATLAVQAGRVLGEPLAA